ncbi:sensor histidine kinase [Tenacibaculum halocynthiae]|uniref:sensor histidine kinase n=1 Tax=Tenacibaculum halocynthiae TaxID=1254437 RepID=UPI003895EC1F
MLYFIKNRLVLFVYLLCSQLAFTQSYPSKNITTLNGLSSNSIYSIKKDSRGILWVGTGAGVSKIVNKKITNFYEEDGLAFNNCWAIEEDSNNNLWFGSYGGGLTFYDGNKFSIYNINNGLVNNYVRKICYNNRKVFVGTKNGITIINIDSKEILTPTYNKNVELQVMGFFKFKKVIYIQTYRNGLFKYDEVKNQLVFLHHNYDSVFSIFKNKNSILVSFDGFAHKNKSIKKFSIEDYINGIKPTNEFGNSVFWDFIYDNNQDIYGVADGINFPTGGIFKLDNNTVLKDNIRFNINSTKQWCLEYDEKNNDLLVGTLDKGLFKVNLSKKVNFYDKIKNIIDVQTKENEILFLTKSGLIIKSKKKNINISKKEFYSEFKAFYINKKSLFNEGFSGHFQGNSLNDLDFLSLTKNNKEIWINTTIGLYKSSDSYELENYYPIYTNAFYFTSNNNAFFQRPYSQVYTIENIGMKTKSTVFELSKKYNPRDIISINKIGDKLYFSSKFSGLYQYKKGRFTSFLEDNIWTEKELTHSIVINKKQLVISNSRGTIFITEPNDGFKIVDTIENKEIIGNTIIFLKSYKEHLIIGTEKGINVYKNGSITFLDEEQGITNKLFTCATVIDNKLFVGTSKGYYEINLESILNDSDLKHTKFNISNIKVNYKDIDSSNYYWFNYSKKSIELPYNQNTISFTFDINNHRYPNKLKYRYKLSNKDWSPWSNENIVRLNYLTNGNYDITGEIKDYSNSKTYTNSLLKIIVTPPFWKTWWFKSLCIGILLFSFYLFYKSKVNRIKKEEEIKQDILKRISATKIEALQSQMNPHFIFNAMNSIQNFIIDNDVDNSLKYMGEFSKLIRKTLHNSSLQNISLAEEVSYLKTYIELENLRFQNKITVKINFNNIDINTTVIPPMLLQPIVENVFKHAFDNNSENPILTIDFNQKNNFLICNIIDNGIGFNSNFNIAKHQSKGIKLVKERLQLLNLPSDSFSITSSTIKGTIVTITLKNNTLNN